VVPTAMPQLTSTGMLISQATRTSPMKMAGQRRSPKCSSAARTSPESGQTGVTQSGLEDSIRQNWAVAM
jgi:hypothetical protein